MNIDQFLEQQKLYKGTLDQYGHNYLQQQIDMFQHGNAEKSIQEIIKKNNLRQSKSSWYAPIDKDKRDPNTGNIIKSKRIHVGEINSSGSPVPTWESAVASLPQFKQYQKQKRELGDTISSTEQDKALFGPFEKEWHEEVKNYYDWHHRYEEGDYKTAGAMSSTDFSAINNVSITATLLNQEEVEYTLPQLVTTINTNELIINVFTYNRFQVQEEVHESDTIEMRKGRFTRQTFTLKKSAGGFSWTDEFLMQNFLFDPTNLSQENVTSDITRVKAVKVGRLLSALSGNAVGNFTTFVANTNLSTVNPILQFATARRAINQTNFGRADTIVSNDITFTAYLSNSYVTNMFTMSTQLQTGNDGNARIITNPPGLPGYRWGIDPTLATGNIAVYDSRALLLLQGPTRTEQFRLPFEGESGMLVRDWNSAATRTVAQTYLMTGAYS